MDFPNPKAEDKSNIKKRNIFNGEIVIIIPVHTSSMQLGHLCIGVAVVEPDARKNGLRPHHFHLLDV